MEKITYRYDMGFKVDGQRIPDPYKFSGADSSLDTMGERDATGYLHRQMVAIKEPMKIEWQNIDWNVIKEIMKKVKGDKFMFTCPDPVEGTVTRECYAGDRDWECVWAPDGKRYIGNLSFSIIEY